MVTSGQREHSSSPMQLLHATFAPNILPDQEVMLQFFDQKQLSKRMNDKDDNKQR